MERKMLWKRGLSFGLSIIMILLICLSPLPQGLFKLEVNAAESTYPLAKSELALGMCVIPNNLWNDTGFMNNYVLNGKMDITDYFKVYSEGNSNKSSGNTLDRGTIMHNKCGWGWNVHYRWTPTDAQRELLENPSYKIVYNGNVVSEYHDRTYWRDWNVYKHKNGWDRAEVGIEDARGIRWAAGSKMKDSGKAQAVSWSADTWYVNDYLGFYAKNLDCQCGESKVTGSVFYMVDTSVPVISDAYVCTDASNPTGTKVNSYDGFSASTGKTGYVVFEFSEKVRFSDNKGKKLEIALDAYDRNTGVSIDGGIKATMIAFKNNRMIFEYTVNPTTNGKATDIYITGVSDPQNNFSKGSFELVLYDGSGNQIYSDGSGSSSCITDIAGNALDWSGSDHYLGRIYYDNIKPAMKDISMDGNMITTASKNTTDGVDRSAIFAGVGDWVDFDITFTEDVELNTNGQMAMVLNIKDAQGEYIKLNCSHKYNTIQSERLNITEGLLSPESAGKMICVTGIEGISSITDAYGNVMVAGDKYSANLSTLTRTPQQKITVDTDAPVITTTLEANGSGVYTPVTSPLGTGEYFTFPIVISENTSNANNDLLNTSQIEPQKAEFALVKEGDEISVDWYVDYNQTVDVTKFKNGKTTATNAIQDSFTPVNGQTSYMHFKLDKTSDYEYRAGAENGLFFDAKIYVTISDNAGNKSEATFPFSHQLDLTVPEGSIDSEGIKKIDYTGLKSFITTSFSVTDDLGIKQIQYFWTYTTKNQSGVDETVKTATQTIDLSGSFEKEYKGEATVEIPFYEDNDYGRKGSAYLTVSYEDFAGYNGSVQGVTHSYDFTLAKSIYTVVGGTKAKPLLVPEVYLSKPVSSSAEDVSRTIMLIPYGTDEGTGGTKYYLYDPGTHEESGYNASLDLIADIFAISSDDGYAMNAPGRWYDVIGTIADGAGTFTYSSSMSGYGCRDIKEYISGIYGSMEIYFVTSSAFDSNYGSKFSFIQATSIVESTKVYLGNRAVFETTITGVKDGENADAIERLNYQPGNVPAKNLDNVEISLSLSNTTTGEDVAGYGFTQLDFENSKIELVYYGENRSYIEETVCEWPLLEAKEQSVVIPEGITTKTGWYGLRVVITNANGTIVNDAKQQFYFMDNCELDVSLDAYYKAYLNKNNLPSTLVAEDEKKENWGNNPSLEIALDTAPGEGWTVDTYFEFSKDVRNDADDYSIEELVKVRVYNKNDADYETNAIWVTDAQADTIRYTPVYVEEITKDSYGSLENLLLPLYEGDNLICYELINTNGVVKSYEVPIFTYPKSEEWALDVQYTEISERTGGIMEVTVKPAVPENIDMENSTFSYVDYRSYSTQEAYVFRDDFDHEFWLLDQNGNLSSRKYAVADVDGEAPYYVGTTSGSMGESDTDAFYHFIAYAYDFDGFISADELTVTFDADYSAVLRGLTGEERINNTDQITMKVPINREKDENGEYLPWESYEPGNNGIYRTRLLHEGPYQDYAGYVEVEIWGTWKYDADADRNVNPDYAQYVNADRRELTFTVLDANGNSQTGSRDYPNGYRPYNNDDYSLNVASFYEDGTMIPDWDYETDEALPMLNENGCVAAYSSVPFSKIYSYGVGEQKEVRTEWPGDTYLYFELPMIQEDGEYTIEFMDLFGDRYERTLIVNEFGTTGIEVEFSETKYTNQPVTINASSTLNGDYITEIKMVADSGQETAGTIHKDDNTRASITVSENCKVIVTTHLGKERTLAVSNIDKTLESAKVVYVNSMAVELDGTETVLDEEVTAILECTEDVEGVECALKYTFPRGSKKGDTYTFKYQDAAGNEGTMTAVLPCDISEEEKEETYVDETAPLIDLSTYGMRNNKYNFITEMVDPNKMYVSVGQPAYGYPELASMLVGDEGLASYISQAYKVVLNIEDDSATKIVVQKTGETAPASYASVVTGSNVEGVTVSQNTLSITKNVAFDLYVIDEADNVTKVTNIGVTSIDNEAPEFVVKYTVSDDKSSVKAIFVPSKQAEALETIHPLDPTMPSVAMESGEVDGSGNPIMVDRYYYLFKENGDKIFNYKDDYGNSGSSKAGVQGISTGIVKVTGVVWNGTADKKEPSENSAKVNSDVIANINVSKAIRLANIYLYDDSKENNKGALVSVGANASVSYTSQNVYVTYTGNMEKLVVELVAAENDNVTYYTLPAVMCIDKKAPVVTVESGNAVLAANKKYMTITLTADEEVVMSENTKNGYDTTHVWVAKDAEPRVLHFTDEAGNITEYTVTQNNVVDTKVLTAVYSALGDGSDESTQPATDFELEAGDSIFVKTNKDAKGAFDENTSTNIVANSWTEIVLPETEGVYMLQLTDSNTNEVSYKTISVQVKDKIAPEITFASNAIVLKEDATMSEMMSQIRSGVSVLDNRDGVIDNYEVTGYPHGIIPGLYELTYSASDAAGNVATGKRTLYIMEEGMTVLYINGVPALPFDRTVVDSHNLRFSVEGFGDEELLTMKIRSGMKSIGQMKRYTTLIQNMETTVSEDGFYTIYVRTQERMEYVTYLYVEE